MLFPFLFPQLQTKHIRGACVASRRANHCATEHINTSIIKLHSGMLARPKFLIFLALQFSDWHSNSLSTIMISGLSNSPWKRMANTGCAIVSRRSIDHFAMAPIRKNTFKKPWPLPLNLLRNEKKWLCLQAHFWGWNHWKRLTCGAKDWVLFRNYENKWIYR